VAAVAYIHEAGRRVYSKLKLLTDRLYNETVVLYRFLVLKYESYG
jgi:hypothetical protein